MRAVPCCVSRSWPRPFLSFIAAFFARGELLPGPHPCIAIANASVEIAGLPWQADLHVAFTDDPKAATVRVQISESADTADFALVDDSDTAEASACEANPAKHVVSIFGYCRKRHTRHLSLA